MAFNKLALIRYKVIDECLRNRGRRWTLEDLIEKVSYALYEYEGIFDGVSKRTIQLDLQMMRSDKLGYNAPIVVVDRKYYTYEDKEYSITKNSLSSQDLDKLSEVVRMLRQFKGFDYLEDISTIVSRLEGKIFQQKNIQQNLIDFEKNELLKGLEWIEPLLKAIKNRTVLNLTYQSFKAQQKSVFTVSPYLLKEYRNRWFLLCQITRQSGLSIYALDRILDIEENKMLTYTSPETPIENFFDDVIGVSKQLGQKASKIILQISSEQAPYIITKPLHHSQEIIKKDDNGIEISIELVINLELEREILGFGEHIRVLAPQHLKNRIAIRLQKALERYIPED